MLKKDKRISIRLTPHQEMKLNEMKEKLGVSYSVMLRAIVEDFLTRNEDHINTILDS